MQVGIRAAYPEAGEYDWYGSLEQWGPWTQTRLGVEVAFRKPDLFLERVDPVAVAVPFAELKLPVLSVHMAHADINKPEIFRLVLKKTIEIAQGFDCQLIVAHPSNAKLVDVWEFLDDTVRPMLDEADMLLCWETFLGGRRFLHGFEDLVDYAFDRPEFAVCYDTAHLERGTEEVCRDIEENTPLIGVFHISNWKRGSRHLRIGDGEIDFEKVALTIQQNYDGPVILEYLQKYHPYLLPDSQWLRYWLGRGKRPAEQT